MFDILRSLGRDRGGNVAMIAAFAIIPLVAAGGLAIDYTRALQFKTSLQGVVDSAALAGASELGNTTLAKSMATTYVNSGIAKLPPNMGVTPTVTVPSATAVTVSATGNVATTFTAMFRSSIPVTVTATAGPAQGQGGTSTLTITAGNFNSSAADANTIYWYIVPDDNSVPPDSALMPLFSNNPATPIPAPQPVQVGSNDKIGFAMFNVTGGLSGYGSNQWGGTQGSINKFYSHLQAPSADAYPSSGENNLKACTGLSQSSCEAASNKLATASTGAPTCAQLGSSTMVQAWNDMGGRTDDYDFNDAVYSFSCASSGNTNNWNNSNGNVNGVVLVR